MPWAPDLGSQEVGEGSHLRSALLQQVAAFASRSEQLSLTDVAAPWSWAGAGTAAKFSRVGPATDSPIVDGPSILAEAALGLIHEMAQRLPPANDPRALAKWLRDSRMLGQTLERLDLWPLLLTAPYFSALTNSIFGVFRRRSEFEGLNYIRDRQNDLAPTMLTHLLFIAGPALDDDDGIVNMVRAWRYWERPFGFAPIASSSHANTDVIADLSRLPIPKDLVGIVGRDARENISLYHALTAFVGSPNAISTMSPNEQRAVFDQILFASACIVGPDGHWPLTSVLAPLRQPSRTQTAAVEALAGDAWAWLAEHLPSHVFAPQVENAILSCSRLRYAT